jgi:hypothetical protein
MFSSALGNLFMILASQAQKDVPKAVQSTAQVQTNAAQIDSSAFNLLLAFVNTGENGAAEGAVDFAGDLGANSSADDLGKDSLADQAAFRQKLPIGLRQIRQAWRHLVAWRLELAEHPLPAAQSCYLTRSDRAIVGSKLRQPWIWVLSILKFRPCCRSSL